jgi:poly-gamma-glutamate synthesis protein (capsule biosynthesis protein)
MAETTTLFLAGDVMTGRGVDQVLPHASDPEIREPYLKDARGYVELAEEAHGPIEPPLAPDEVWGDALAVLRDRAPDASIINLETSVTGSDDFWPDKGIHYRMHPGNVDVLRVAGVDVCGLANNHVLDFGRAGLKDTLQVVASAGAKVAGAGPDLDAARAPAVVDAKDRGRVLVFAVGHTSSGIPDAWAATAERSGVALLPDLSASTADALARRARDAKARGDVAVVSIHWGGNWDFDVSKAQSTFAHRLVDGGVDVVHAHSSHHVRPIEVYAGKLILHGCGDLITDYEGIGGHQRYRGDLGALYFATVRSKDGALVRLELVPTQMRRLRLRRAPEDGAAWMEAKLNALSAPYGVRVEAADGTLDVRW